MKKVLFVMMAAAMMVSCGNKTQQTAQNDLDGFKLHVYNTNDVMGDASYIIEGQDSLIVMEYPLFKVNAAEFAAYIEKLGKPVEIDVTDYRQASIDDARGYARLYRRPYLWWHDEAVCLAVWRHDGRVAHAESR